MSQFDVRFVKRGYWTNLEQGSIMGKTLTTDVKTGTIIIAFLAILSSLTISQLWKIVLFLIHQIRANGAPADGLFRQQQALLRSLPTPGSMLVDMAKLWWTWRHNIDHAFRRSLFHLGLSTVFMGATLIAGIFSSNVVSSANLQVLVQSPFCGPINLNSSDPNVYTVFSRLETRNTKVGAAASLLAKECYRNNTDTLGNCQTFTRPNIPFARHRARCPFSQSVCAHGVNEEMMGVQFDSGLVDLNEGFGLNLEARDRVKFRKRTTYSVLQTDPYTSFMNATQESNFSRTPLLPEEMVVLHYGGLLNFTTGVASTDETYIYSLLKSNFTGYYSLT